MSKKVLLFLSLSLTFISAGCGNVLNSNSFDEALYGATPSSGTAEFLAAKDILDSKCINCHTGFHASWASWDEADYITFGRVVAGDPSNSTVYTKIRGNEFDGAGNMPEAPAPDLTAGELLIIRTWIESI